MINTEGRILGKDYCNYFLANPKLYQLMGWEINSEEDTGIIEDKSTNELRFYWSKNYPENECWFDQMLIGESAKEATMEATYSIYAPYIAQEWDKEALKLYKHMRRTVGCTNGCFFGDSVTTDEKCRQCYEKATNLGKSFNRERDKENV